MAADRSAGQRTKRRWRLARPTLALAAGYWLAVASPAAAPAPQAGQNVLQYLDQTIDWYRRVVSLEASPIGSEDVLFRDAARQQARQALRLAFQHARAEAALLAPADVGAPAPASGRSASLSKAAAAAMQRVAQLQARIEQINVQMQGTSATSRPTLEARRDKLLAESNLAIARRDVLQSVSGFMSDSENGAAGGLLAKIDDLERSVPEAQAAEPTTAPAQGAAPSQPTAAQSAFRPESAGAIGLVTELFNLSRQTKELDDVAKQSGRLRTENQKLLEPVRAQLRQAIARGDALASTTQQSDDPDALAAQRRELDALATRFRQLSAVAVPLGEQGMLIDAVRGNLSNWDGSLDRTFRRTLRYLVVRLAAVGITILVLLGISNVWRRATFRYVTDPRRRVQFLLLRRIVIGCIIALVVAAGVVTEFSSLATFAGLITAGIAVALQSVILSGAAYFFFIGRYGVRVGDRVTISGITGDVLDTGVFRLYLMELGGSGRDLNPTGRIVVFSNSVLFQSAPFFKQLPGADYTWHELALTLSPETDYHLAEKRLMEVVESVLADYRESLERQYAAVKGSLHLAIPPPRPEGRLRFVDAGLEFVVRYPVEIRRATEIDDRITRRLLEAINQDPKLKLVPSGTPTIQPTGAHA